MSNKGPTFKTQTSKNHVLVPDQRLLQSDLGPAAD